METTKSIVAKDPIPGSIVPDEFERTPFEHPQLQSLDNLTMEGPRDVVGKDKLYHLAAHVGLIDVVRWKPRLVGGQACIKYTPLTSPGTKTQGLRSRGGAQRSRHGHHRRHHATARGRGGVTGCQGADIGQAAKGLRNGVEAGLICIIYLYCTIWGKGLGAVQSVTTVSTEQDL